MTKNNLKRLDDSEFEIIASRFRALSESSRLKILAVLQEGEHNVTQLVEKTQLSQPNVSRHLGMLINASLIGRRKVGNNVLYRIVDKSLAEICGIVCRNALKG